MEMIKKVQCAIKEVNKNANMQVCSYVSIQLGSKHVGSQVNTYVC